MFRLTPALVYLYHIFMEFAYSSTTVNAFNACCFELDLSRNRHYSAIQLENWTSGSGQFQVNGGTLFSIVRRCAAYPGFSSRIRLQ